MALSFRMVIWTIVLSCTLTLTEVSSVPALEKTFRNGIGMEFVMIPAGTFFMGSPETEPRRNRDETRHEVRITRPFYMQTTEVTVGN